MEASLTKNETCLVPGVSPQLFGEADFNRIAQLLRREAGIVLDERKRMLAYSRVAPLVRRQGLTAFSEFLDQLENDPALATEMIASLTTNHTYFNREPHHFEHFVREVRQELIEKSASGETVRIWSAACSSGEEIWSLLMFLLGEDVPEGKVIARQPIIALASDLAEHVVASAEAATYPTETISAMPPQLVKNWCLSEGDMTKVGPALHKLVRFRQLNLLQKWPFSQYFDVIFCRNVMIYFDGPTKERLVTRLAQQVRPGGYLYIGHSERISGQAEALLDPVGPTVYRRRLVG